MVGRLDTRGWSPKFATVLKIIIDIVQKIKQWTSCPFARMIPLGVNYFGKRTAWSPSYFLSYTCFDIYPSLKFWCPVSTKSLEQCTTVLKLVSSQMDSYFDCVPFNISRDSRGPVHFLLKHHNVFNYPMKFSKQLLIMYTFLNQMRTGKNIRHKDDRMRSLQYISKFSKLGEKSATYP